jgi:hypothetical protein
VFVCLLLEGFALPFLVWFALTFVQFVNAAQACGFCSMMRKLFPCKALSFLLLRSGLHLFHFVDVAKPMATTIPQMMIVMQTAKEPYIRILSSRFIDSRRSASCHSLLR